MRQDKMTPTIGRGGTRRPGCARAARTLHAAVRWALALSVWLFIGSATAAHAADRIRLAVQKTGTFALELAIIKDRGLDKAANLDLETTELASTEAGNIALRGGSADIILTDWLWVARERSLGVKLAFEPYSSTIGALMVPPGSKVNSLADLTGKTIAVAGGPLDKSWLLLRALAERDGLDLKARTHVLYGAPALLAEKAVQGEADANLNFWNFCAGLEARGFRRLIGMDEVEAKLGAKGKVAMLGYVFDEDFARQHRAALQRFFAATRKAKDILAHSDSDWQRLAPRLGIKDAGQLALYRRSYVEGIPHRPIGEEVADARALYRVLAKIGGRDLVGSAQELPEGTFYQPVPDN